MDNASLRSWFISIHREGGPRSKELEERGSFPNKVLLFLPFLMPQEQSPFESFESRVLGSLFWEVGE